MTYLGKSILTTEDLAAHLASMDTDTIARLRHDALVQREQELLAKEAARLADPAGTVRYIKDDDILLVRGIEAADGNEPEYRYWEPYFPDKSGSYIEDEYVHNAGDDHCPIIGRIVET
jgi:hypothetical protein